MKLALLFLLAIGLIDAGALFSSPIAPDPPSLPKMRSGCVADLLVGTYDCFRVFDDGTWIRKRSY